jgi:hypothetical protein
MCLLSACVEPLLSSYEMARRLVEKKNDSSFFFFFPPPAKKMGNKCGRSWSLKSSRAAVVKNGWRRHGDVCLLNWLLSVESLVLGPASLRWFSKQFWQKTL